MIEYRYTDRYIVNNLISKFDTFRVLQLKILNQGQFSNIML